MIIQAGSAMAHRHREGRFQRLSPGARRVIEDAVAGSAIARRALTARRRRVLLIATLLIVGAAAVPAITGSGGQAGSAFAALSGGATPGSWTAAASGTAAGTSGIPDSLAGVTDLDPIGLLGKGVLVVALLYVTLRVLRHVQAGSVAGQHRLEILETRPLGPKASLSLVAVGERRIVVGLTPAGMVALAELDASELGGPVAGGADEPPAVAMDRPLRRPSAGERPGHRGDGAHGAGRPEAAR